MSKEKINYIELPVRDIEGSKRFFTEAFGWGFTDYGPDYTALDGAGLAGGFFRSDLVARADEGSALVVLYSNELEAAMERVEKAGGTIVKPVFTFPGGRRFQFTDPSGNEWAVWSDQ